MQDLLQRMQTATATVVRLGCVEKDFQCQFTDAATVEMLCQFDVNWMESLCDIHGSCCMINLYCISAVSDMFNL